MRCQFCDGGKIDWPTLIEGQTHAIRIDCPECGGTGHLHCCEGLREQPEKDREDGHRLGRAGDALVLDIGQHIV